MSDTDTSPAMTDAKGPNTTITTSKVDEDHLSPSSPTSPDSISTSHLLLKLDLHIIPILYCLFVIMLIDRANIGNVKIEGILKDLNMVGNDYNIALLMHTVPFIVFELPSNLALRRLRPGMWVAGIMAGWGICTIGEGLTRSYSGLLACRFLVGMFEAGFQPCCAYLISQYYRRYELQKRFTIFFSASIVGGAFGGFLAYALEKMNKQGGYAGWRWIFIMEGIITIVLSVLAFFFVVPLPEDTTFLTQEEKTFLLKRLELDDSEIGAAADTEPLTLKRIVKIILYWKVLLALVAYFAANTGIASITSFQPTILKSIGYTASQAQIHTIPVYMVGLVTTLTCSFLSDHFHARYPFLLFGSLVSLTGWIAEFTAHGINPKTGLGDPHLRYFGMFCIATGAFTQLPLLVVWVGNNLRGRKERIVGLAVLIGGGQSGNLVAANVFITGQTNSGFKTGFASGLGVQCLGILAAAVLVLGLWLENRGLERKEREAGEVVERGFRNTL